MLCKVGQRRVLLPAPVPRTFRRQLAIRVRAATNVSQHFSQTPSPLKPDRTLTAWMTQFVSQIGDWWTPTKGKVAEDEDGDTLTIEELTDQLQKEMEEAESENKTAVVSESVKSTRPNIWKFLKQARLEEIQKSRIMASLANATYYLPRLQFKTILEKYGFHLVTTSAKCKQSVKSAELVDQALMMGDGMAVAQSAVIQPEETKSGSMAEESNIVAASELHDNEESSVKNKRFGWHAHFNMGTMAGTVYSQTVAQLARQVSVAATVSQSALAESVTRVMKLLQVALRLTDKTTDPAPTINPPGSATATVMNKCPTEWFVCDDAKKQTRIFCIQGTHNFESWQTNLTFDPVPFEDDTLGVRVHRGIYEAAQGLYSLFVPLIRDHIESGQQNKICFAGHSLGGAIASVLVMMLVHRGDLPIENVGQVFTFGGAASFCDSTDCSSCPLKSYCNVHEAERDRPRQSLLERLGLPGDTAVNVIMHKDIVPRAFACDYSLVADLLRKWSSSFRKHDCLAIAGRALLYNFIGEVHVLQPHEDCHYVCNEGYHPMLPPQAALYKIVDPDEETHKLKEQMLATSEEGDVIGHEVDNKRDAFLALMDNPHPLDMLGEPVAYGENGAISRYHNPLNYSNGLRSIITHIQESPESVDPTP